MRSLILLCLFCSTAAKPEDLSGKSMAFIYGSHFNLEDNDNTHVTIPLAKSLNSATVCLRYLMDRVRDATMFSISNLDSHSGVYVEKRYGPDDAATFHLYVNGTWQGNFYEPGRAEKRGGWNSLCMLWDAMKGRITIYLNDGERGEEKESPAESLSGPGVDSPRVTLGGRYSTVNFLLEMDVFDGEVTDLHVWDSVLSVEEIQKYVNYKMGDVVFTPGNVLNWKALTYKAEGKLFLLRELSKCE